MLLLPTPVRKGLVDFLNRYDHKVFKNACCRDLLMVRKTEMTSHLPHIIMKNLGIFEHIFGLKQDFMKKFYHRNSLEIVKIRKD